MSMEGTANYGVFLRLANGAALRHSLWEVAANQERAMTHAWVFTGPPGSGRSIAAKVFAAALLCENTATPGCGECWACKAVFAGTHSDLLYIHPEGLSISVATVREVVRQASLSPDHGRWRIVIVEDADRLTEGAANAFLKTVEEPPARTVIILCTPSLDPQDLIVTLRSRCRHVYVPTPKPEEVEALLGREFPDAEAVRLAGAITGGHIGRARAFLAHVEVRKRREEVLGLLASIGQGDVAFRKAAALTESIRSQVDVMLGAKEEEEKAKVLESFGETGTAIRGFKADAAGKAASASAIKDLEDKHKKRRTRTVRDLYDLALIDMVGFYRDVLLRSSVGPSAAVLNIDQEEQIGFWAGKMSPVQALAAIDAVMRARELLAYNVGPDLVLSSLVGRLKMAIVCA
ncbi:MAG: DNA polymerase III subunit delta' [Corynebacterium sp.]|nr:DNA polymerase III subunit delta' [Corynebacterium sp.]